MAESPEPGPRTRRDRLTRALDLHTWRRDPSQPPFSGWRIVALCAVLLMMTGPGQTLGVSVFIDPMIAGLELTRSQVSTAYLIGTLAGALGLPVIGRFLDTQGPRRSAAIIGVVFGVVLLGMAGVRGVVTLTLGFVGIRMLGQGGLTVIASTAPARWFDRRRGLAIGITTAAGSAAIALIPLVSTAIIIHYDWRAAWVALAFAVWVIVLPIVRWGLINNPADVGQYPDGRPPQDTVEPEDVALAHQPVSDVTSMTAAEARRTPIFWAVTAAVVAASLITTALNFHQISILGEQGLTPIEAAANFVPQTIAGLAISLYAGAAIDRFKQRYLLLGMLGLMAAAMVGVSLVEPGLGAITYGIVLGSSQGAMRSIESGSYPKLFGVNHAGEIRGTARAFAVASSALGPLALAFGFQLTGSYRQVLLALLVLPAIAAVLAIIAPEPGGAAGPAS